MTIRNIEINFELPVDLGDEDMRALDILVGRICEKNCPDGWVFWPAGMGSKPNFSKADSLFLGKPVNPDAPDHGEPTWDDSVFHIDCAARELSEKEIEDRKNLAAQATVRRARWDSRLAGWLHRHGLVKASWWVADLSFWAHKKTRATK